MIRHKAALVLTIGIHYGVFISFVLTGLFSFLYLPWFIAIAIISLVVRVIFSSAPCPLTLLENNFRIKLKLKESKGFLKDYIVYPARTFNYLKSIFI